MCHCRGRDKFENETLIQWGWPEDIWSVFVVMSLPILAPLVSEGLEVAHILASGPFSPIVILLEEYGAFWNLLQDYIIFLCFCGLLTACRCGRRFHVDDMSSAHVYLRMPSGKGMDDISPETLNECCQLVKVRAAAGHLSVAYYNHRVWLCALVHPRRRTPSPDPSSHQS